MATETSTETQTTYTAADAKSTLVGAVDEAYEYGSVKDAIYAHGQNVLDTFGQRAADVYWAEVDAQSLPNWWAT